MNRRDVLTLAAASLAATAARAPAATSDNLRLAATRNEPLRVAEIVGNGANVMDFSGPWEVFQGTMIEGWDRMAFELFMVSDLREPIKTGLLDGKAATTHHEFFDSFARKFPAVHLDRSARYVENPGGKPCSAGGITSGIELALRVVERYFGEKAPAQTAFYMEYRRSPNRPLPA